MKVAMIGSRSLTIGNLAPYLPEGTTEIVSGGARGVDSCARAYAERSRIAYTEFLPDYEKYGRAAPLVRNRQIVDYADVVVAFWDGKSRGTKYVVDYCAQCEKMISVNVVDRL